MQDTISVHRPSFYAQRFLNFMATRVFKKVPQGMFQQTTLLILHSVCMQASQTANLSLDNEATKVGEGTDRKQGFQVVALPLQWQVI